MVVTPADPPATSFDDEETTSEVHGVIMNGTKTVVYRHRGEDPPAAAETAVIIPSVSLSSDEENDGPTSGNSTHNNYTEDRSTNNGEGIEQTWEDDSIIDEDDYDDDYDDDEQQQPLASTPPKRTSYSKDLLKPTKEGSLIQAGVDPGQVCVAEATTPAYIKAQLKPTGFAVKQGVDVPRDHVALPVDPNAHLADVYKSHRSTTLKSTGFADQLKQGGSVPRDSVVDPNAKLGDVYKSQSTKFKSTGLGDKLKQGQDISPRGAGGGGEQAAAISPTSSVENNTGGGELYASVTLKKTGNNPDENLSKKAQQKKKKSNNDDDDNDNDHASAVLLSAMTKLQKTQPGDVLNKNQDEPKKFELPEEFSKAKQNLKRRTERPWYSKEQLAAINKPKKKWFFQRGEWNNDNDDKKKPSFNYSNNKKKKSWFFFGGGSKTTTTTPTGPGVGNNNKGPTQTIYRGSHNTIIPTTTKTTTQHYNELSICNKNTKKPLKPFDKQYYEEIQRRRKGLSPKPTSMWKRILKSFLLLFVFLPFLVGSGLFCAMKLYPEQTEAAWKQALEQPQVQHLMEQVQPTVIAWKQALQQQPQVLHLMEKVQPLVEQVQPTLVASVDRICTPVEVFVVPQNTKEYQTRLMEPMLQHAKEACSFVRTRMGLTTVGGEDARAGAAQGESSSKVDGMTSLETDGSDDHDCVCQNSNKPKWRQRLQGVVPGRNKNGDGECSCVSTYLSTYPSSEE